MTELMVERWNAKVKPGDEVYHLGDVSFGTHQKTEEVLYRLNGKLHLIEGNHDKVVLNGRSRSRWNTIQPYLRKKIYGQDIVMFHYPIQEWDCMHRGAWHLYGHVHGKDMGLNDRRALDVGVDNRPAADMNVWSFEEVLELLKNRAVFSHH